MGSIHENSRFWTEVLECGNFEREVLENGYKVPIDESLLPDSYYEPNNKSARDEPEFVKAEVTKLLERGCIVKCKEKPRFCNPLTVAAKNGKKRLVLDLSRCINTYLEDDKFKLDDIRAASEMVREKDYMIVMDL